MGACFLKYTLHLTLLGPCEEGGAAWRGGGGGAVLGRCDIASIADIQDIASSKKQKSQTESHHEEAVQNSLKLSTSLQKEPSKPCTRSRPRLELSLKTLPVSVTGNNAVVIFRDLCCLFRAL